MGVQQQPSVVNKPKSTKPISEARKIRKPLMERKRRERINTCLNDLASLLIDAKMVKSEAGKPTKLEKADILELTVKHIKSLRTTTSDNTTPESKEEGEAEKEEEKPTSSYKEGFTKCMGMVDQTLGKAGKESLRQRLLSHLKSCLQTLEPSSKDKATDTSSSVTLISDEDSEERGNVTKTSVKESNDDDMEVKKVEKKQKEDDKSKSSEYTTTETTPKLTLVPTRLPSGGVAFIIQGGIDPNLLLPQTDTGAVKGVVSEVLSSPPLSPTSCDSSTPGTPPPPSAAPPVVSSLSPVSQNTATVPSSSTTSSLNLCITTPPQVPVNNQVSPLPSPESQRSFTKPFTMHCPTVHTPQASYAPSSTVPESLCPSVASQTMTTTTPMYEASVPLTAAPLASCSVSPSTSQQPTSTSPHLIQMHNLSPYYPEGALRTHPIPYHLPVPHHSHNPPTPPPSISPQQEHYLTHEYRHYHPASSEEEEEEEEDMDTDGLSEEDVDVDVENDVPYDLSMRRIWRYW